MTNLVNREPVHLDDEGRIARKLKDTKRIDVGLVGPTVAELLENPEEAKKRFYARFPHRRPRQKTVEEPASLTS